MKITKNQLKELIRYSIYELTDAEKAKKLGLKSKGFGNWVDPKTGQHYSSKGGKLHKVDSPDPNKSADIEKNKNISRGDKDKLGKLSKMMSKEKPSSKPKVDGGEDNPFSDTGDDVGGPAHPNVPKKKDTMQQPFYKISYTDSEGREKTDSMRASSPEEAKKDFENMNKGRGFKVTGVQGDEKSEIPRTPQPDDFDGDMEKYLDALNQHMKDVEQSIEKDKGFDSEKPSDEPDWEPEVDDETDEKDSVEARKEKVYQGRKDALNTINSGELNADNMQDTFEKIKAYADWMGYEEIEEFEEELEDMIEDQDTEWFIDRAEELLDPDKKEKEMGKNLAQMDYEDEDSPESYYESVQKEAAGAVARGVARGVGKAAYKGAAVAALAAKKIEKKMKDKKKEKNNESKVKRTTVKEIKKWMKSLEENRYKKTYNSDCRRVAWFVNNNLSEDYESMPKSMAKKWTKAAYGRERFLAKEFIKHMEVKQMNEVKLEEEFRILIREFIKKKLVEAYRSQSIFFNKKDKSKLEKLLKKHKGKFPFNPAGESVVNWSLSDRGSKGIEWGGIPKSNYNKAIEFFMKNKLNPRG